MCDKVLILDQVQRRGRSLANRCFLCLEHEESIEHLLLHYEKTGFMGAAFCTFWEVLGAIFVG